MKMEYDKSIISLQVNKGDDGNSGSNLELILCSLYFVCSVCHDYGTTRKMMTFQTICQIIT